MTYTVSRDKAQNLGNIYHYWLGSRKAAEAAAAKANEAQAEYTQHLLALMDELGIDRSLVNQLRIDWGGTVTITDPFIPTPTPQPVVAVPA